MFNLWAPEHSVLREKALEHIFLSELSKALLLDLNVPFEVLRSEFDANGYDIVVEARGIIRHVQLKVTRIGGKRRNVDINLALAEKPSGCVVWMMADPETLTIGPFYWLGAAPGVPLTTIDGRITRHSKGNASGEKTERRALRNVAMGKFQKLETMPEVARAMFGASHSQLLADHLIERDIDPATIDIPDRLSWSNSIEIAHIIDGYELASAAGFGDGRAYQATSRARAEASGRWTGSTLELWLQLFLEHRREKFGGAIGVDIGYDTDPILEQLCEAFLASLADWKQSYTPIAGPKIADVVT